MDKFYIFLHFTFNALLIVVPPRVNILSLKLQVENTNLSINCNATPGNPNTTRFLWTKVDDSTFRKNEATLQLPKIQRTSSGTYRCTAKNTYSNGQNGSHSGEIFINVLCKICSAVESSLFVVNQCSWHSYVTFAVEFTSPSDIQAVV